MLRGDIGELRPVVLELVQLELVRRGRIGDGRAGEFPRRTAGLRAQHPAVVVEPIDTEHLEILGAVAGGRIESTSPGVERIGEPYHDVR